MVEYNLFDEQYGYKKGHWWKDEKFASLLL